MLCWLHHYRGAYDIWVGMIYFQWHSQNAEKVRHIKGRLLDQAVILFNCVPFQNGNKFFPLRAVPYAMENHFYHIRWPPLNVTILIAHVRNGSYADVSLAVFFNGESVSCDLRILGKMDLNEPLHLTKIYRSW